MSDDGRVDPMAAFAAKIRRLALPAPSEAISGDLLPDLLGDTAQNDAPPLLRLRPGPAPVEVLEDRPSPPRQTPSQRLSEIRRRALEKTDGPQGETLTTSLGELHVLPLEALRIDPRFQNSRQFDDPHHLHWSSAEGQTLEALRRSMQVEGQKNPIHVYPDHASGTYLVRAGFRRWRCARELGWRELAAIVLRGDTPIKEQHWLNILENTARKSLTTYEVACSAKFMRDELTVTAQEYADRSGYSVSHVQNLLRCLDRLPTDLVEQWRTGARLSLEEWCRLAVLSHDNARRFFRRWTGQKTPSDLKSALSDKNEAKPQGRNLPPWLADRCRQIYEGIEGSPLPPRERDLALAVIELCTGQRSELPGVYEPRRAAAWARRANLRRAVEGKLPPDDRSTSQED